MTHKTAIEGMVDTGQEVVIPAPVFDEMLEHDPQMALTTPVIPLLQPIKWADERQWCRYALQNNREDAATCPNLARDENGFSWCRLMGKDANLPCFFDEPEDSEIYRRVLFNRERYRDGIVHY